MSAWPQPSSNGVFMQDASSQQNLMNPSMAALYNHSQNNAFDVSQFQNNAAALQQGMQNGNINPQAAFGNQTYNVNPIIPTKRPRPSDDAMAASPRPNPNAMNPSRSQTPMQNNQGYPAFSAPQQQSTPQQQFQPPTPFQRLQQGGSANATPSPTMQNQQFRPPHPPQRMSTASPATFNQTPQGMAANMSPAMSNQNGLPNMMQQGQGQAFGSGQQFNQAFGGTPASMGMSMPGAATPSTMNMASNQQMQQQQQQYQQRLYQQRLQQTQQKMQASQANNLATPQRPNTAQQASMFNQTPGQQPNQTMPNGGMAGQATAPSGAEKQQQWLRSVATYLQQHGKQLNPQPQICGRPLGLYFLWACVLQVGGSARATSTNMWPAIAQKLQFPPQQYPSAPQELRATFESILGAYERTFLQARLHQRQQQAQMQARQMAGLTAAGQGSPSATVDPNAAQSSFSQMQQMQQRAQQQAAPLMNQQAQMGTPLQRPTSLASGNGIVTPQIKNLQQPETPMDHRRNSSLSRMEPVQSQEQPEARVSSSPAVIAKPDPTVLEGTPTIKREASTVSVKQLATEESTVHEPRKRNLEFYGGYDVTPLSKLGDALNRLIPDVPLVEEMGVIDLHALTLSLQSGIHAEVRYSLDHLTILSVDPRITLDLEKCDDLTDVLVDCGEEQLDILSEEAAEVSDALDLLPYEDVVRACRSEAETLQDVPAFGSTAYELDRAADRLIAVTQLLRNFSFNETNHRILSSNSVIGFMSNAIRLLGTRNMLLRNSRNVADFYKDVITFLSNITGVLELPSRDDALHILQFILVFAPQPYPSLSGETPLHFAPYAPLAHRQLPLAVDCLAKLLARQEPNRSLYRSIFATSSSPNSSEAVAPLELLTAAFGLSIAVLPERSKRLLSNQTEMRTVEARKAVLTQGMLAADILASMVPATSNNGESGGINLARAWLESEDRWASGLLRMAYVLLTDPRHAQMQAQRAQGGHMPVLDPDHQGYGLITQRGLEMLVRLVEKAGMTNSKRLNRLRQGGGRSDDNGSGKMGALDDYDDDDTMVEMLQGDPRPMGKTVLAALGMPDLDKTAVRLLCGLYDMVG